MATINAVNTSLSGQTGTGNFVGANTPTLITPNLGVATATSVNFSNPATGGIIGTTTNNSASTGYVGEYVSANVAVGSAISATTNTPLDITSISLTAGDWDVSGVICTSPNAATVQSNFVAWVSSTSATQPAPPNAGGLANLGFTTSAGVSLRLNTGVTRISLSGTTTIYLSATIIFSINVLSVFGFIGARRAR